MHPMTMMFTMVSSSETSDNCGGRGASARLGMHGFVGPLDVALAPANRLNQPGQLVNYFHSAPDTRQSAACSVSGWLVLAAALAVALLGRARARPWGRHTRSCHSRTSDASFVDCCDKPPRRRHAASCRAARWSTGMLLYTTVAQVLTLLTTSTTAVLSEGPLKDDSNYNECLLLNATCTSLSISSGISGTLPTELGYLSVLTRLDESTSSLSGSLPSELGLLSALTELWIDGNPMLSGSLPSELGRMTSMQYLVLSNNAHTGLLPTELGLFAGYSSLYYL